MACYDELNGEEIEEEDDGNIVYEWPKENGQEIEEERLK